MFALGLFLGALVVAAVVYLCLQHTIRRESRW